MTRDEAISKIAVIMAATFPETLSSRISEVAACEVDMLSELGILKLDERKSAEEELRIALNSLDDDFGLDADDVFYAIRQHNLKVVRA